MKLKSTILRTLFGLFFVILIFSTIGIVRNREADKNEKQFCSTVTAGTPLSGLKEKALANGANKKMTQIFDINPPEHTLLLVFNGAFQFDRYICEINFIDDKVTSVKHAHMD